jgi:cytochrome c-type biogenesis protein CcmH
MCVATLNMSNLNRGRFRMGLLILLTLILAIPVQAQEPLEFEDQQMQDRFSTLKNELRCAVCQNQSLADSDAPLAHDLRREVYNMLKGGKSDAQIKQFMVDRYGDFVLYRPPVQANTWLLWLGPLIMLLIGALVLRFTVKKRSALLDQTEATRTDHTQTDHPEHTSKPE